MQNLGHQCDSAFGKQFYCSFTVDNMIGLNYLFEENEVITYIECPIEKFIK
jgi:hypothetical protein